MIPVVVLYAVALLAAVVARHKAFVPRILHGPKYTDALADERALISQQVGRLIIGNIIGGQILPVVPLALQIEFFNPGDVLVVVVLLLI